MRSVVRPRSCACRDRSGCARSRRPRPRRASRRADRGRGAGSARRAGCGPPSARPSPSRVALEQVDPARRAATLDQQVARRRGTQEARVREACRRTARSRSPRAPGCAAPTVSAGGASMPRWKSRCAIGALTAKRSGSSQRQAANEPRPAPTRIRRTRRIRLIGGGSIPAQAARRQRDCRSSRGEGVDAGIGLAHSYASPEARSNGASALQRRSGPGDLGRRSRQAGPRDRDRSTRAARCGSRRSACRSGT